MKHFPSLSDSALKEPGIDYTDETDDETTAKGYGRRKYTEVAEIVSKTNGKANELSLFCT